MTSVRPAADDDFVECRNAHLMTVLVLPSRRRVRPAADDDFVECRNAHLMTVLVLPSRRLVRPAADDDFVARGTLCLLFPMFLLL